MTNNEKVFDKAIALCGGTAAVAEHFGICQWAVRKWRKKQIPSDRCKGLIELSGGKLTFEELRPDLF